MATVHVSIGHNDDLVIAELREVQRHAVLFGADGHAESRVDVADLFALENLVLHRLLYVEDLTTQREDRLELTVTTLLSRTTCRVTLDEEELRENGVLRGAVGELTRQATTREGGLALYHLTRLACSLASRSSEDDFVYDDLRFLGVLFEIDLEGFADGDVYGAHDFVVTELGLRLPFELGLCDLDAHDGRETFAEVIPCDLYLDLVEELRVGSIFLQRTRQTTTEACQVRTPFDGVDVVDVAVHILVVRGVVSHRDFDRDTLLLGDDVDDILDEVLLGAVDVLDELLKPLLRVVGLGEGYTRFVALALIGQREGDTCVEEGELAQTSSQDLELVLRAGEDRVVGLEEYRRTRLVCRADSLQLGGGDTTAELLRVDLAVAMDGSLEEGREGIDTRDTDPVQTARDLVGALVELTPCVQDCQYDLQSTLAFLLVDVYGDTSTVVLDFDGVVLVDGDLDLIAVACQGLVD